MKKDLNLRKLAPKFVPKVLTDAQKAFRVKLATSNITRLEAEPGLLAQIIATDESWIFTFDPRTKSVDMEWTAPGGALPCKAIRGHSQKKTMLILFFDSHGTICTFFNDEGTVDSDVYIASLKVFREALRRKRPKLWSERSFILLQDNASPHTSIPTLDFLHTVDMADKLWPHPQYSPDLSPCDYWVFPVLKSKIRGNRFENLEYVKTTVKRMLREIPLAEYQNCFDNLLLRYKRCVQAGGEYLEGQGRHGLGPVQ